MASGPIAICVEKEKGVPWVSIADVAKLFGMTPEETVAILQDNHIVTNSVGNRLFGYRFGGDDLERVGLALKSAGSRNEPLEEIEVSDIESLTDLPHATLCEAYGLPEDAHMLPVALFHEHVEAVAQLRWCRQRTDVLKWKRDANRAHRECDDVRAEAVERGQRVQELKDALDSERTAMLRERERADTLERELAAANSAIANKDRAIDDKEREANELRRQFSALRDKLSRAQSDLRRYQNELERSHSELLEHVSHLNEVSKRVSGLEEQLELSRQSQLAHQSLDALNAQKAGAVEFWNRWLDADESACKSVSYTVQALAQTLAKRQEAARKTLFGAGVSSYDQLRGDANLLKLMKQLGFGNDIHPDGYTNPRVIAYYTLRYELGYAFEYYEIYRCVLETLVDDCDVSVLSIGCGQGLDYWGLRCAQAALDRQNVLMHWHGIDLETWPESVLHDDSTYYEYDTDLLDFIEHEGTLRSTVLMLPKIISELPMNVINRLAEWLERVELIGPVHYLCIAHTDRDRLGGTFQFLFEGFEGSVAVKSAKIIDAFLAGARRQGYVKRGPVRPGVKTMQEIANAPKLVPRQYKVVWSKGTMAREYDFLAYEPALSACNIVVGGIKPFDVGVKAGPNVHDIGKECCSDYVALNNKGDCASEGLHEGCPKQCPLYRRPRFMTDRMAYQIYRVERPQTKNSASSASIALQPTFYTDFDEDIPF